MNSENNPMRLVDAPRCGAKTRSGAPCASFVVHGKKRCRMHGGIGSGAPRGNTNALKHGLYSARAIAERREIRSILAELKKLLQQVV
jgi:uncharacterized protein YjcR